MDGARLFSDLMVQVVADRERDDEPIWPRFQKRLKALPPDQQKAITDLLKQVTGVEETQRPLDDH